MRVAEGEIHIEVNDAGAMAKLRAIENDFDRTMSRIDRQRAEVDIGADLSDLRRGLAEAEAAVKAYERRVEASENDRQLAARQRHLETLRRIKTERQAAVDAAQDSLVQLRRHNKELELTEKRIVAIEKREAARQRTLEQAERRRLSAIDREARVSASLNRQREREMASAHRLALQLDRDRDRQIRKIEEERASIPKLQRQYAELAQTIERLARSRRKTGDQRALLVVDLKIQEARTKMLALHKELERIGGPIDIDVDLHPGRDFGLHIRRMFKEHGIAGVAFGMGVSAGDAVVDGMRRRLSREAMGGMLRNFGNAIGRGFERLGDLTIRLGPFTASIRQAMFGLAALAPLLVDVVGAMGALVSVTGAATLGVGALGLGFLGGAIPAALGFGLVISDVADELDKAFSASRSYNDAVMKYGRNSDQAKTKLEQLNKVLAAQSESTRRAFISAGRLGSRWRELTEPARQRAFHLIGEGLDFASKSMDMFAKRTNTGFGIIDKALTHWLDALRSDEAQTILGNMMTNFNKALRPGLRGLGDLIAYLGKVGSVASNSLPGLAKSFRDWANGVLRSADDTEALRERVDRLIDSARTVGTFLKSLGRFLVSFFNPGVEAGRELLEVMTDALDGWTRFNRSVEGRKSLADFFNRSVNGVRALWNAFAPLVAAFTEWAALLAPAMTEFLKGASYVAKAVAALTNLVGLGGPLATLAATLGAIWAVKGIGGAIRSVVGFTAALLGLGRAAAGIKAISAGAGAAGVLGAMLGGGAAGKAGRHVDDVAKKSGLLRTILTNLGGAAAGAGGAKGLGALASGAARVAPNLVRIAGPAGAAIGAVTALSYGLNQIPFIKESSKWNNEFDFQTRNWNTLKDAASSAFDSVFGKSDWAKAAEGLSEATEATDQARDAFVRMRGATNEVGASYAQARINFDLAKRSLSQTKRGTIEHRQALLDYRSALAEVTSHERLWEEAKQATRTGARNQVTALQMQIAALKALGADTEALGPIYAQLDAAQNRQAAVSANLARSFRGMSVLAGQAEQVIGRLARTAGRNLAIRIATSFENPRDVMRVAQSASAALRSGVPRRFVVRIIANADDAEDAIKRLNNSKITDKKLNIVERGGREAVAMVQRITGMRLPEKLQRIVARGGPQAMAVLSALIGTPLPTKTQRVIGNAAAAIRAIGSVIGIRVPDKTTSVIAQTGQAVGAIAGVIGLLNSIPRSVTSVVTTIARSISGRATGGPHTREEKLLSQQLPQVGRDATSRGRKVNGPTLLTGEENRTEYVIATNPAYRRSNIEYLKMAARDLGVTMAARGYMPARRPDPEKLRSVRHYWKVRRNEEDQNRRISIAQSQVREPDTFIREVGKDEEGNPLYDIDQGKIDKYSGELGRVKNLYNTLIDRIMPNLQAAAQTAYEALGRFRRRRRNAIDRYQDAISRDQRIVNQPLSGSRANRERQRRQKEEAKRRIQDNKGRIDDEVSYIDDSHTSEKGIKDDQHDARFRRQEYEVDRGSLTQTIDDIGGRANEEKDMANPSTGGPVGSGSSGGGGPGDTGPTPPTAAERSIAQLEAELAMSQAGLGGRSEQEIVRDLIAAQNSRIAEAQAMLGDADSSNDMEAYNIIQSAANAINNLNQQLRSLQTVLGPTASEFIALGSARYDLFRSFSSNLSVAQQLGAPSIAGVTGPGASPAMISAVAAAQAPMDRTMPIGGRSIKIDNHYEAPPPDPHTWSRNLEYELQMI